MARDRTQTTAAKTARLSALLIAVLFTLADTGCDRAQTAPPRRWEYEQFTFDAADAARWSATLTIPGVTNAVSGTEQCHVVSLDDILHAIGQRGWDLAWSDGRRFVVKRPAGVWPEAGFSIVLEPKPNQP